MTGYSKPYLAVDNPKSTSDDGGGPEDPMLEARVGRLEEKVDRVEAILTRLEPKISEVLQNTSKHSADLNKLQLDFARFESSAATKDDLHKVQIDLARVDGRVASLPTWWMLLTALIATWGAGFVITNYIAKSPAPVEKTIEKAPTK